MATLAILFLSLVIPNESPEQHLHWSGNISKDGQLAKIYLCFDPGKQAMVFGLPDQGFIDLPVKNLVIDPGSNSFKGNISIFGFDNTASIDLVMNENTLKGTLIWHGESIPVTLASDSAPQVNHTEEVVKFNSGDVTLAGTLILPADNNTRKPAIIFIPGSGPFTRYWALYYAHHFAKLGYASLTLDKRGCGESSGSWTTASLDMMASDVVAASEFLRTRNEIDKGKIGLWGISQGGWVLSRAAATGNFSFLIVNSGGGISPYEEEMFSYDVNLDQIDATAEEKNEAHKLLDSYFEFLKNGKGRNELVSTINASKSKSWYKALEIERVLPSEKNRANWAWVATYDPLKDIAKIKSPVLLLFGTIDNVQPTPKAIAAWKSGLSAAGNENYSIKLFHAGHGIRLGGHGHSSGWPTYAEGFLSTQMDWLEQLK